MHTQIAVVSDTHMSEAAVYNDNASLKVVEKLLNYFTSLKKVKTNMSNNDQAGSALAKTLWKILCLKERKFLLSNLMSNFPVKGRIYYVTIVMLIFSLVKITRYCHV